MKTGQRNRHTLRLPQAFGWLVGLGLCLVACVAPPPAAPGPTAALEQRLRITNQGAVAIKALTVFFSDGRLDFGDIAPRATTDYQAVPGGVLRYAAYEFEIDGQVKSQPVIDWIGEQPLPGAAFTYQLDFDPTRWGRNEAIQLMGVLTDQ